MVNFKFQNLMVGWNQKRLWTGLTVLNIILIGKKCQRRGKLSLLELKLREAASTWWKHNQNDREMRVKENSEIGAR